MFIAAWIAEIGEFTVPPCCKSVSTINKKLFHPTNNHGVETSTREAESTDEVLSRLELILEVCFTLDRAIGLSGTVVEALINSQRRRNGCCEGEKN